jgi:hypothetical protein
VIRWELAPAARATPGRSALAERLPAVAVPAPQVAPTAASAEIALEAEEGESAAGKVVRTAPIQDSFVRRGS